VLLRGPVTPDLVSIAIAALSFPRHKSAAFQALSSSQNYSNNAPRNSQAHIREPIDD
jgi:hypothetical protein